MIDTRKTALLATLLATCSMASLPADSARAFAQQGAHAAAARTSKHVVFVGIDGPMLARILELGPATNGITNLHYLEAYAGGDIGTPTQQQTSSGPGWSTLLTGVWANEHGVDTNNNQPINSRVQSLYERIDAAIPNAKIASFVSWAPIHKGHFAREAGLSGAPAVIDRLRTGSSQYPSDDETNTRLAVATILDEAPDFTFTYVGDPDAVGHAKGAGADYDQALIFAAEQVKQVTAVVAKRMAAHPDEDWLVIVSADHGRTTTDGRGHGGTSAGERRIFVAANKPIRFDGAAAPQTSVAATILDFLGIDATGMRGPSLLR